MKFLNATTSQIEKIVSTEIGRFSQQNVYFDAERCHMVATNGHALAVVHVVPEEGDVTGFITPLALQAWRKALKGDLSYRRSPQVRLQALEKTLVVTSADGRQQTFPRPHYRKGDFPTYEQVFPTQVKSKPAFLLDIKLLVKLVEALGHVDTMTGKSTMVAVFPSTSKDNVAHLVKTSMHGPIGIIMPMRAPDEKDGWLTTLEAVDTHFAAEMASAKAKAEKQLAEEEEDEPEPEGDFPAPNEGENEDEEEMGAADELCPGGYPAKDGVCGEADCKHCKALDTVATKKPVKSVKVKPKSRKKAA